MRAELVGERAPRLVLRARRDPQGMVAPRSCFRDQLPKQDAADALTPYARLHAESDLRHSSRRPIGRMQLRSPSDHAAFDIDDDYRAIIGTFRGIVFDEAVVQKSVKTVTQALRVEPQQMIAQQRQFLLLSQGANGAHRKRRPGVMLVVHGKTPLG